MMANAARVMVEEEEGKPERQGAAVWFTGLPGSGKSTLARAVQGELRARGADAVHLSMDECRQRYFPTPCYSDEERREAYRLFAEEAAGLVDQGRIVLMDGSGPELAMRRRARDLIPRFAEIHLRCPVATAMTREASRPQGKVMAGLYAKAMKRKATGERFEGLGSVIGVDVPFEEDPAAELILDAGKSSVDRMRAEVVKRFAAWWG
jgi:adenylylsulfate kinase